MSPEQQIELGAWMREKRSQSSLERIAETMSCSMSAWQRYEKGARPVPLELLLRLSETYSDMPAFAVPPRTYRAASLQQNHSVQEDRPVYGAPPALGEFERRLKAMSDAQAVVTDGLARYDLKAEHHVTLHQMLTLLIVRNDITPTGLAEVLQWYAFDVRARAKNEGSLHQAPRRDAMPVDQTVHFMGTIG